MRYLLGIADEIKSRNWERYCCAGDHSFIV